MLTEDASTAVLRVRTPDGEAILKRSSLPQARSRAEAAAQAARSLRGTGYPAPEVWLVAETAGETIWLQRLLAGTPAAFALPHSAEVVRLTRCHVGRATAGFGQDWNAEVQRLLDTRHGAGNPDMDRLWRLIDAALPAPTRLRNTTDLVHGDFHPGNFLCQGEAISGVVDWDGAGFGSRAIDLAQLLCQLYDAGDDPGPVVDVLVAEIVRCEGTAGLLTVVAAQAVRSALWGMTQPAGPAWSVGWAERMLRDLAGTR